ncbi:MAG: carbohydrate binding domain-containing protein [Lachnospiraceae bacterium]|nr:carbohydrate binding domain-containing protein [Lachnospiraceae bacterium]
MNKSKNVFVTILFVIVVLLMTGCGGGKENIYVLPTLAPTNTPLPQEEEKPTPTTAPDAAYTKVIELDGEDFNQTTLFRLEGEGSLGVKPLAYAGSYSFCMSGRGETWNGISLAVADKKGNAADVAGKKLFFSTWVYHETGKKEVFSCALQVKKPDGTTDIGATITKHSVPSNTWTLVEGYLPVYANVTEPRIRMEMSSSKESFYFDDVRISFDPTSVIAANKDYFSNSFEGIYFDFENGKVGFTGRGGGEKIFIEPGGAEGSANCLVTTNRSQNWNGPSIDLSEYGLAGETVWVSFSASHGGNQTSTIKCTIQELAFGAKDESKATYTQIVSTKPLAPGEWAKSDGKYKIKTDTEKAILYFETDGTEDIHIDNVLITAKDPSTLEIDPSTGSVGEKVDRLDISGFETVYSMTADDDNELSKFLLIDNATVQLDPNGYSGSCYKVTDRGATWSGVGLHFDKVNMSDAVIGKQVYVSFWVYQDSGKTLDFSATLQVNKPDGTAVWPERVAIATLPSGKWTFVEGMIPIYANVAVPQINFEIPTSADADYYLDEILIAYDPNSNVPANQAYAEAAKDSQKKTQFKKLTLDFEDNNAFFMAKGNGKPTIVYGGHESEKCLLVSGRSQNWHGVTADFSKYDIAGRELEFSFWMYHEYDTELNVILSAEQNDGVTTTYVNIVSANSQPDGKWTEYSGSYVIPQGLKKIYFYFESPNATAEFYLDDVVIDVK